MTYLATAQHTSSPVLASAFGSGSHLPVEVAVPVIAAVVLLKVVAAKMRGRPALGGEVVVRCSQGHLFRTHWSSLGSLTSIRLGSARFQQLLYPSAGVVATTTERGTWLAPANRIAWTPGFGHYHRAYGPPAPQAAAGPAKSRHTSLYPVC
jgi:hypothetical protein